MYFTDWLNSSDALQAVQFSKYREFTDRVVMTLYAPEMSKIADMTLSQDLTHENGITDFSYSYPPTSQYLERKLLKRKE